jgi:hypothetical protein
VAFIEFLGIVYLCLFESGSVYPFSSFRSNSYTTLFLGEELFPSLFVLPIFPLGTISVPGVCVIWY